MKTDMLEAMESYLAIVGVVMTKQLSSGLFGSTYDRRSVRTLEDVDRLTKEGFYLETDPGIFLWNAFKSYKPKKAKRRV